MINTTAIINRKEVMNMPHEVTNLPVNCLYPHPDNPRKDLGDLTELTDSIKANGILQNLTVVPGEPGPENTPRFTVIIGHRRLAAAKLAGLDTVPCVIAELSPEEQLAMMLVENVQRSALTPYEEAKGFEQLSLFGKSVKEIQDLTGFGETTVRNRLKVAKLDDTAFREAADKQITFETLLKVAKIQNTDEQGKVLAAYGTNNFAWNLQSALTAQDAKKNAPAAKKEILSYAKKADNVDYANWDHVMNVNFAKYTPGSAMPKDGTKGEYFATIRWDSATIYRKRKKSGGKKKSKEEVEKAREIEQRETELSELTEAAYKLRREFMTRLTVSKKDYPKLMKQAVRVLIISKIQYTGSGFADHYNAILKLDYPPKSYIPATLCEHLLNDLDNAESCAGNLIAAVYAAYGDSEKNGYFQKAFEKLPNYRKNPILDYTYDFLCAFGYELSDTEKALKNGTHPLLSTKKTASNGANIESGPANRQNTQ